MPASTTTAPELTQEQVQRILVQPLQAASVFLASSPRIFDVTAAGVVRVPKLLAMTAPNWHGENELITEVDADFGEVRLLDGIRSLKSITRYSNELARSSVVALDAALRDRMVLDVAAKLDAALIAGTGDPDGTGKRTTPLGLINYTGIQAMPGVGDLMLDDLHDAIGLALGANVEPNRLRWMMRSDIFVGIRKVKDSDGKYILEPDVAEAGAYRLLGLPVTVTSRIPWVPGAVATDPSTTTVVLWDPSQVAVARDLAPSVKILSERYADFDQQAIRVVARYDAAPLNPEAIVTLRGVTGVVATGVVA
jgi:HK97 family phage major capsid protein